MKKENMLKKNHEFKKVFLKGKYYYGKHIEMYIMSNSLNENKVGICVSKKTANSVKRNKIKRLMRENYRFFENSIIKGYNIVIVWKKTSSVDFATFEIINKNFEHIFNDAKLIKGDINEKNSNNCN